ncbi:hypothetical protein NPX13_g8402 [Xylaria arbuscula]|uniref:gamma-glutamylcyclotransferase n=1 Tax=Xylaria arbuscula TaxID=114810 RepID=A0A9W8TJV7_9PEZI|nr:hypothetical protein NPX13_g8402 [Xylaria arbuscula]
MALNNREEPAKFYFAYGSNLSTTQMQHRCPRSTPIGLAHLAGWTWIINERGYANIVADGQANDGRPGVYGLVYRLHPDDENMLDRYEGVPFAYEKVTIRISKESFLEPDQERSPSEPASSRNLGDGDGIELLTYIDILRITSSVPQEEYIDRMNLGIKESSKWGLPAAYVDEVMRRCIPAPRTPLN